ncbi:MAG: type VI secretion system membrane-associated complex protein TssK [Tannerella sp.]|nr:type VI secretion system membrane-associated complex protein TssK [Tannerella sp.]
MKISREHLVQTEDYMIDTIRDSVNSRLTGYNFGLLPPCKGETLSGDFEITERISNCVEIELRRCNAITSGGCRIDINPNNHRNYLKLDYLFDEKDSKSNNKDEWDVILIVHPFGRVPTGTPDPDETPPRHPFADRAYTLSIKPIGQINVEELGMHHLIIGRIIKKGEMYEVDKTYIPPCMTMLSHPDLKTYYERFGKYLNDIEVASQKIIQKILENDRSITIAKNTQLLCEHVLGYIVSVYFKYRNMGRNYAPIEIADIFSSFAHMCFVSLNFIPKKQREEMLQYFYEWSDVTPGNFVEILTEMLEVVYDHHNIRLIMEKTEYFLSVFSALWIKLSTLEYIGQHKENIVVSEKIQKQETGARKTGWTIID